jgi:hypothetical protein
MFKNIIDAVAKGFTIIIPRKGDPIVFKDGSDDITIIIECIRTLLK